MKKEIPFWEKTNISTVKKSDIKRYFNYLKDRKLISMEEYAKAKQYYQGVTCSDLIIIDHHEAG